ncbi:MAG: HEPN domain-containing protein [Oscillospiraceae bacterium]|nr:HEPN domain-containing protein [Oscillospiraceae bacterium]
MSLENRMSLSRVRLEKAEECLADAKLLLESKSYRSAANRSYYAVFHAMRAVLALDGYDSKHHSGVIAEFRRLYIKTGIFETNLSDIIRDLFDLRTDSDYNDFFVAAKSDIAEQVYNAEYFIGKIKTFLLSR